MTHDCAEVHEYYSRTFSARKDTAGVGHELLIDDVFCSIEGVEIGLALFDMHNFGLRIISFTPEPSLNDHPPVCTWCTRASPFCP